MKKLSELFKSKKNVAIWKWVLGISILVLLGLCLFLWKANDREPEVKPQENAAENPPEATSDEPPVITVEAEEEADTDPYHGSILPMKQYAKNELPRIVCWGDSLTETFDQKTAYPDVLATLTDAEVINEGLSSDSTRAMAIRCGALALTVEECTIPASTSPVKVKLRLPDGKSPLLLQYGDVGINPCRIGDVEGTLEAVDGGYTFTRTEAGKEEQIASGTPFVTQGAALTSADDVVVLFSGANDGLTRAKINEFLSDQKMILDHLGCAEYIVVGVTYAKDQKDLGEINEKMHEVYGEHFLDIRDYFLRFGLEDAGLVANEEDELDILNGLIPVSLRQDYVHGTPDYYRLLAEQVYRKMMQLGYLPTEGMSAYEPEDENKTRVVFWGDSITECTGGNGVTFPNVVKELAAEDGKDITVKNYGVYGERSSLIAARAGGNPMRLNETVTIPADTEPVEVALVSDMFGWEMLMVFGGDAKYSARPEYTGDNCINPCVLAGVEGILSMDAKENKRYFTRLTPGDAVVAKEGEQIFFRAMRDTRKDDILVIWSGTNDELTKDNVQECFRYIHSIIDFTGSDRYIVVNMQKIEVMPEIDAINEAFAKEFGDHCLDIYSYLLNDAMDEAGLTPTEEDKQMLKERRMPMSIRSDMEGHFNEAGYTMIGHEIYRKLCSMGYL